MEYGKITFLNVERGIGFIESERLDDKVFFGRRAFEDEDLIYLIQQGEEYKFEYQENKRRRPGQSKYEAKRIVVDNADTLLDQYYDRLGIYKFHNPYNFVTFLEAPATARDSWIDRCAPPPHDRFVGYTGKLVCELKAISPLFISDPEMILEDTENKEHKLYNFFKQNGRHAIPASSLRGMVRSVFEAATNSCMEHFHLDKHKDREVPLEYRSGYSPEGIVPARVKELNEKGAVLEIFDWQAKDCPKDSLQYSRGKPIPIIKTAGVFAYSPCVLSEDENGEKIAFVPTGKLPENAYDGMPVETLINKQAESKGKYQYFIVDEIGESRDSQTQTLEPNSSQEHVFGYLHLTGPNIEKKRHERIFFQWNNDKPAKTKFVDKEVVNEYDYRLEQYWERNKNQVEELEKDSWQPTAENLPHPSTFVRKGRKLKKGGLVYYFRHPKTNQELLRPVTMPRVPHAKTRQELLPEYQKSCSDINKSAASVEQLRLCPACRIFGWVQKDPGQNKKAKTNAIAGRIVFTHATIQDKPIIRNGETTLAILDAPKPTTVRFYLKPKNQVLGKRWKGDDAEAGYDNDNTLRGRKFYRRHPREIFSKVIYKGRHEYERFDQEGQSVKTKHNRTITDVPDEGNIFTFEIRFENLADVELGALLWALEMEENMAHRLGYAKPLGFGSVKVTVTGAKILNPEERYKSFDNAGWESVENDKLKSWKESYVVKFKAIMQKAYGVTDFVKLENIRDLRALLEEQSTTYPVHYPRSSSIPQPDGKNYEWFMGNKRKKKYALPLATMDAGLPLIDKKGKIVEGHS